MKLGKLAAHERHAIVGGPFGSDLGSRHYRSNGVPVIRGQNMGNFFVGGDFVFVSEATADRLSANIAYPNDIIFTQRGTISQVSIIPVGQYSRYLISQSQMKFSPGSDCDGNYIAQYFRSVYGQRAIEASAIQTGIPHTNLGILRQYDVPTPPLAEQRAIAEALGDVDALIGALDSLIAKKRDVKRGAMQRLLTGATRLPGFSEPWETVRLGDIMEFKNGINKGKQYFGYGVPIVNYMDVYRGKALRTEFLDGKVDAKSIEMSAYEASVGDVFFTRTSETAEEIGLAAVLMEAHAPAVFSGFLLRGRDRTGRIANAFKAYCFRSEHVRRQIKGKASYTTRALTTGKALASVELMLPSLDEQRAIAAVLSDMDAEIEALEARRAKTADLKKGMMRDLLTGRVRLTGTGEKRAMEAAE